MKDKPNKLDDIIREKMKGLGSSYRPETWDRLNDRLDAMDNEATPMDDIIRDKLAHLGATYRPESWEALNDRLDSMEEGIPAEGEMQSVDELVYDRMHRFEKPYDPNHWPLLLKKLEANAFVGETIIRYKAMELSLLVLLLITFVRLPVYNDSSPPSQAFSSPAQAMHPSSINSASKDAPTEDTETLELIGQTSQDQLSVAETSGTATDNGRVESTEPTPSSPILALKPVNLKERGEKAMNDDISLLQGVSTTSSSEISKVAALPPLGISSSGLTLQTGKKAHLDFKELSFKQEIESAALTSGNEEFDILMLAHLSTSLIEPNCLRCTQELDKKATITKRPTFFRIGMQGGPDYNRVITPPTPIEGDIHEADRYSLGYSGGITFGLEKDRWEIETGIMYSNKSYYSLPVLILDGSVEDGFIGDGTKQIDLDIFQVPLNFRYNFIRKNRWRVYAMAGMSLHLTTQSNYYLAETEGFATDTFRPDTNRPNQENNGRNGPSVKGKFDNFAKGWLEGGSFRQNSYISGNVGIGLERFITDYWSIYAQPTYRHSLLHLNGGLGPFYDRIHTNSVLFGVKIRLK